MDRKGIIATLVAFVVLLWWTQQFGRQTDAARQALVQKQAQEAAAAKEKAVATQITAGAPAADPSAPVPPEAKKEKLATPAVEYLFTNVGGGIDRVTLLHHLAEGETPVELNSFGPAPIGAVTETPDDAVPQVFTMTAQSEAGEVNFERIDAARQLKVAKKFQLPKPGAAEEYLTELEVSYTNQGSAPLAIPGLYVHTGSAAPVHQSDLPSYVGLGWLRDGSFTFKDSGSFTVGGFLWFGKTDAPVFTENRDKLQWAGVSDQYFTTVLTPLGSEGSSLWARRFTADKNLIGRAANPPPTPPSGPSATVNLVEAALGLPGFTLAPGQTVTQKFTLYTGPREYSRLLKLGAGQDAILDFGTWKIVCKFLLVAMNWLHSHLGNYAAAIAVLTLLIRTVLWPIQNRATQSMKRMQALNPEINALKEKYKDDPVKMTQEQRKLMAAYGVNPVGGCLPQLITIPIFFGFYKMLGRAVELRNAHFLWVHDFSQPDTVGHLLGFPINLLPLVMTATSFGQMQLSPKSADPAQQRIQMFIPLIFLSFCYNYASALALYLAVQNTFSIVQLYLTKNQTTPALQKITPPGKKKKF